MKVTIGRNSSGTTKLRLSARKKPGDRAQRGGDRQRLELVGEGVLAQRPGGVLVLADRPQHPAPGRLLDAAERERQQHATAQTTRNSGNSARDVGPAEVDDPALDRVRDRVPGVVEAEDALGAAGQLAGVQREQADRLRRGDRRDREVVGAQPQRRQPDEQPNAIVIRIASGSESQKRDPVSVTRIAIE